jgi:hypothetical protein
VEDSIMLIAAVAFTWIAIIAVILFAWSRIGAHARWEAGIDEEAYVNGLDEATLAEAA